MATEYQKLHKRWVYVQEQYRTMLLNLTNKKKGLE